MSRRGMAGAAALALAVIAGVVLVPNLRGDGPGASPAALKRIAQKNERAAVEAAAVMRAESEASAAATDTLLADQERGRAEPEATPARPDNGQAGH